MADPDAVRYLRIAKADLTDAQRMVELSGFRDSSIGFLLQQACEKALKGWIHSRGGLAPSGADVSPFERIADLNFFAVQTRYDDNLEITTPDWELLLRVTESLIANAQRQL